MHTSFYFLCQMFWNCTTLGCKHTVFLLLSHLNCAQYNLCFSSNCLVWNKHKSISVFHLTLRSDDMCSIQKMVWMKWINSQFDSWWCKVCNCRHVSASLCLHVKTRPVGNLTKETGNRLSQSHKSKWILWDDTEKHIFSRHESSLFIHQRRAG